MPIVLMLREHIGLGCAGEGLQYGLQVRGSHAKGSADGDGPLSEPLGDFIVFADYASVMRDKEISTKRSSRLPVLSSVAATLRGFVRRTLQGVDKINNVAVIWR